MDYLSLATGFLMGAVTGAASTYLGLKFTDQRRAKEAENNIGKTFESLWDRHHALMLEMKEDLEKPENKYQREFFLQKSTWSLSYDGEYLAYYIDKHQDLEQQIRTLESHGFLINVTESGKNVSKYRFGEEFVKLLKNKKL